MLNSHFFSSINFLALSKKGKCYNHSSSYLFLLRYAEIQKGKCNNDFLSYQFLLRILSACGERMYSSTICFHLRRQSQPLKKLWTFLILAMSGSSSSSLFSPLKSIRLMSFQLRMKIWTIKVQPWPDWGNSMTSKILDWKFKTYLTCVETIQYNKEFWIVLTQMRRLFNSKDYENKKNMNNWNFLVILADLFFSEISQVLVSLKLHNPTDPSWLLEVDLATWGRSLHSFLRANNYKIKLN